MPANILLVNSSPPHTLPSPNGFPPEWQRRPSPEAWVRRDSPPPSPPDGMGAHRLLRPDI